MLSLNQSLTNLWHQTWPQRWPPTSPNGHSDHAHALRDSGSSACFISNTLAKHLHLRRSSQSVTTSGVTGITHSSSTHVATTRNISLVHGSSKQFVVSAIIVSQVTCDLPIPSIVIDLTWSHLQGLTLADPHFNHYNDIDILLGVVTFSLPQLHGRLQGPPQGLPNTPSALETEFGRVLAGSVNPLNSTSHLASYHTTVSTGGEILQNSGNWKKLRKNHQSCLMRKQLWWDTLTL